MVACAHALSFPDFLFLSHLLPLLRLFSFVSVQVVTPLLPYFPFPSPHHPPPPSSPSLPRSVLVSRSGFQPTFYPPTRPNLFYYSTITCSNLLCFYFVRAAHASTHPIRTCVQTLVFRSEMYILLFCTTTYYVYVYCNGYHRYNLVRVSVYPRDESAHHPAAIPPVLDHCRNATFWITPQSRRARTRTLSKAVPHFLPSSTRPSILLLLLTYLPIHPPLSLFHIFLHLFSLSFSSSSS